MMIDKNGYISKNYQTGPNQTMNYSAVAGHTFTYVSPTTGGETTGIIAARLLPVYGKRNMLSGSVAHSISFHVISELGNSYDLSDVYFNDFIM